MLDDSPLDSQTKTKLPNKPKTNLNNDWHRSWEVFSVLPWRSSRQQSQWSRMYRTVNSMGQKKERSHSTSTSTKRSDILKEGQWVERRTAKLFCIPQQCTLLGCVSKTGRLKPSAKPANELVIAAHKALIDSPIACPGFSSTAVPMFTRGQLLYILINVAFRVVSSTLTAYCVCVHSLTGLYNC